MNTIEDTIKDLKVGLNWRVTKIDLFFQTRTLFVDGLFGLMADYSIPLSGEDSGMLSTIKTSLDSLSSSTETKKANKSALLGKFQEELSSEVAALKENLLNITQVSC